MESIDKDINVTNNMFRIVLLVINKNLMLMTCNKLYGKIWRKLCKCRHHPQRQIAINTMNNNALSLSVKNKEIYDKWITESYNNIDEIHTIMREHYFTQIISYNADNIDTLSSRDITKLVINMDIENQKTIVEIMSRFTMRNGISLRKRDVPLIPN